MAFHVDNVYFVPHRDLLVLSGRVEGAPPVPGGSIDLPREVNGPGWVPILDVQTVPFAGQVAKPCVILEYSVLEAAPLMEFKSLEGLSLEVRRP